MIVFQSIVEIIILKFSDLIASSLFKYIVAIIMSNKTNNRIARIRFGTKIAWKTIIIERLL